ncbi:uncharacterized protein DSM5745_08392 [Aspergillus mulundensis]|uniref:Cholesterol oxidase n=1 Tax=Aspergillus mulundensis TaxID=1810919 RepID=A0A3D8RAG9_9EURO|nr:Uncharacterized protein DSM5745_08392 [Aspergillus mulundensis]RDW70881.1 Uncharacterized protein DSM5745_08392 [Aspergillus mulundensis]
METRPGDYPILSLPVGEMKHEYDVVVVGSGYGAGVAASRMARAGKGVAVLEVGREWRGLGGGSLINAGVFLEATPEVIQMSAWPAEIREDPDAMAEYYARASTMLQPTPYPETDLPAKTKHLEDTGQQFGKAGSFSRVPLTTFFERGRNASGVSMCANQRSGRESTGLDDGSKNSIPVTYLVDAWVWGAEIFCGCEVRYLERDGSSYIVHFVCHEKSGRIGEQQLSVRAKEFCFLGAGALGTTEILLRSKKHGYNSTKDINGVAGSNRPGPTITSMIDLREVNNPLEGYIIEDGCIPEPIAPVLQILLILQTILNFKFLSLLCSPLQQIRRVRAVLKSLLLGPLVPGGAMQRTATYLIMSHDSNEITMTMRNDEPRLEAVGERRGANIRRIKYTLRAIVRGTSASMVSCYSDQVSAHLLGGATMSRNGTGSEGVTNHLGQVFMGHGAEVHAGLVCCDASVIPMSLGVNPLATITALAERSVALLGKKRCLEFDLETKNGEINADSRPRVSHSTGKEGKHRDGDYVSTGWEFTEALEGYIAVPASASGVDCHIAEREGRISSSLLRIILTVEIYRRVQGATEPRYKGICTGTVSCRALSRLPMRAISGELDFFVPDEQGTDSTTLSYTLPLRNVEGTELTLTGLKTIDLSSALSIPRLWKATTTVEVHVTDARGERIGAGVVRIPGMSSLYRQMRTFHQTKKPAHISMLVVFLLYFMFQLIVVFFHPLISRFWDRAHPRTQEKERSHGRDSGKQRPSAIHEIVTSDNVKVKLDVYNAAKTDSQQPPILFLPGITGLNPAHSIFTLPFQRCNMVEYFASRGHRCYVLTPRWGLDERVAGECTVFDSRLDIAAALEYIGRASENSKPYIVAHCQGSVALSMALLTGTIKADQILGITANSVFMNQVFAYWNAIKASSPLLIRAYELLDGPYFPIDFSTRTKSVSQRILDFLLSLYPVPRRDRCSSPACHRTSFAFGLLWNHRNLDRRIHDNIDRFFTGTSTKSLEHITRMDSAGSCLDNNLNSLLTIENLENLRGVPILFISGSENEVFSPETTLKDYELLRRAFGEGMYRRFLVDGYGHLDPIVGKNAERDVYWRVKGHVECCLQNEHTRTNEPNDLEFRTEGEHCTLNYSNQPGKDMNGVSNGTSC